MEPRKYKKPLKNCRDCGRLCFIIDENGEKQEFCPILGDKFVSLCDRKKLIVKKEDKE